ncbi:hypothetical protein Tco_1114335 [Tanacetum coccineum]|uniref:Zinc finger, CCHC-type n=1 Tax=Tanacetum coccineum TaxID=301880 RepID=A0ABQ5IUT2_9ASTR
MELHDVKKRVWFEVRMQGAQRDREAEVFQVSNNDTVVAQRRLEDKQLKRKIMESSRFMFVKVILWNAEERDVVPPGMASMNTMLNIEKLEGNIVQKHGGSKQVEFKQLGPGVETRVHGVHDEKRVWFEVELQGAQRDREAEVFQIGFKTPVDMLGFFGWLASIKQGMLEPVKVHIPGIPQKYSGEQHLTSELFGYREDSNEAAFVVAAVEKIYAHKSLTFNNTVAYEVISKWKAGLKDDMDARSYMYAEIWATKGLLDKAKGNVLGMEIIRDQSDNTLRAYVRQLESSRIYLTHLEQQLKILETVSTLAIDGCVFRLRIQAIASTRVETDAENNQLTILPNGEKVVCTYRGTMMYMTEKVDIRTETNWEEMQATISVMEGSGKHHEDEPSSRRSQYVE